MLTSAITLPSLSVQKSSLVVPAAKALAEYLRHLQDNLIDNLKRAQDVQAQYYDANDKRIEFAIGD